MSDTAKGPLSGYLFQFEKALLVLSRLESPSESVSIEKVDDVASHSEDGTVLTTIQLKHSLSVSGTNFEDTSHALWRTLQIWIEKIEKNILDKNTKFTFCTNQNIPITFLIHKIKSNKIEEVLNEFEILLSEQKNKLAKAIEKDPKSGNTIKSTIKLIKLVLKKKEVFEIIKNNIHIEENETIKELFLNNLHLSKEIYSEIQIDNFYQTIYGWIISVSKAKWLNSDEASFEKKDFNKKWGQIINNSAIRNAIFRTKSTFSIVEESEIDSKRKNLFVKQIDEINRRQDAKERIIKNAIIDYIYRDIELAYIIEKGDFTKEDFEEFLEECCISWQEIFDSIVKKEISEYSETEKNDMAITIYDKVILEVELKFKGGYSFTTSNKYIKNGTFLKLSDTPKIGWHPEWEIKYKK